MSSELTVGGLIVSIVSGLAIPFFNMPLLGYHFEVPPAPSELDAGVFDIHIFNYGLGTAESLVVIVESKDSSSTFDFTSDPYVGNRLTGTDETRDGFGIGEIELLPPLTGITLTVHANNTEDRGEEFTVHLQSKQMSGYPRNAIVAIWIAAAILVGYGVASIVIIKFG